MYAFRTKLSTENAISNIDLWKSRKNPKEKIRRSFLAQVQWNDSMGLNNRDKLAITNQTLRTISGCNGQLVGQWINENAKSILDHHTSHDMLHPRNPLSLVTYYNKGKDIEGILDKIKEKILISPIEGSIPPIFGRESEFIEWNGHYFRSPQELAITKELDNRKVLFFPNAGCRVTDGNEMKTREVDFLICIDGNWGILECDSDTYHTSAAKDHKRDELFNRHGIWFIKRFTSEDCQNPVNVVDNFLQLMEQFYNRK